jgi:hypothetical protein
VNEERKKQLGTFYSERGGVNVNLVYEEVPVSDSEGRVARVLIPTYVEFLSSGVEMRVKVEDLDGFVGMLGGHAREVRRARMLALRDLDKLGVKLSGR